MVRIAYSFLIMVLLTMGLVGCETNIKEGLEVKKVNPYQKQELKKNEVQYVINSYYIPGENGLRLLEEGDKLYVCTAFSYGSFSLNKSITEESFPYFAQLAEEHGDGDTISIFDEPSYVEVFQGVESIKLFDPAVELENKEVTQYFTATYNSCEQFVKDRIAPIQQQISKPANLVTHNDFSFMILPKTSKVLVFEKKPNFDYSKQLYMIYTVNGKPNKQKLS